MASAKTPTNGLKIDVAALRMSFILGALNWGVRHLLLLTTYHSWPTGLEQDGRNRTAGARRPTAPAHHCALHYANREIRRATMYVTTASAAG